MVEKSIRIGILMQLIYTIITLVLILIPYNPALSYYGYNVDLDLLVLIDFKCVYSAGQNFATILTGVQIYYNPIDIGFRCLPFTAVLYAWCSLVTYEQAQVIYTAAIMFSNLLTCYIIYKIIGKNERGLTALAIYLASPIQIWLILAGNNSSFAALCLIGGYYLLKTNKPFWGGLVLGTSILFKPLLLCIIPFVIALRNRKLLFKETVIRLVGFALPILPNMVLYLINPEIIRAFIEVTFGMALSPLTLSITALIALLFSIDQGIVFLFAFIPLEIILFIVYYRQGDDELNYLKISTLIAITTFSISWSHYVLYYSVFAIISFTQSTINRTWTTWKYLMFITPVQYLILTIFNTGTMSNNILYIYNPFVSIPYVLLLVFEITLLIKSREVLRGEQGKPIDTNNIPLKT